MTRTKNIWNSPIGDKIMGYLDIETILLLKTIHTNWKTAAEAHMKKKSMESKIGQLNLYTEFNKGRRHTAFELVRRNQGLNLTAPLTALKGNQHLLNENATIGPGHPMSPFLGPRTIHLATFNADYGMIRMMYDHGANMNVKDKHGRSPLNYACDGGYITIIKTLIKMGVDIDTQDHRNKLQLHPYPMEPGQPGQTDVEPASPPRPNPDTQ